MPLPFSHEDGGHQREIARTSDGNVFRAKQNLQKKKIHIMLGVLCGRREHSGCDHVPTAFLSVRNRLVHFFLLTRITVAPA